MATLEELVVTLTAETAGLRADLKNAQQVLEKSTTAMGKSVDKFAKEGAKDTSFFQKAWATMVGFVGGQLAIRALDTATGAFKSLFNELIVNGVAAASATDVAMNDLLSSLARSGNYAASAKKDFEDFAGELQNTTKFGDDAVLSAASMIENLTRLDRDGLKAATKGTVDLAAALNLDLNTASQLVGKAIEGNVGALSRYGIKVEEGSTKSQTFANVMDALNSRFGGAAAAQLKTYSGITTALGNTWQDLTKVFGNAIIQNPAVISALNGLNKLIQTLTAELSQASPEFRAFIADALKPAAATFNILAQGALFFVSQMNALRLGSAVSELDSLEEAQKRVQASLERIKESGSSRVGIFKFDKEAIADLEKQNASLEERIEKQRLVVTETEKGATKMDEALSRVSKATTDFTSSIENFDSSKAALEGATVGFKNASVSVDELNQRLLASQDAAKAFADKVIESTGSISEQYALQLEELTLQKEAELITEDEFWTRKMELIAERQAEEAALLQHGLDLNKVKGEDRASAEAQLQKQQLIELRKFEEEKTKVEEKNQKTREQNFASTLGTISTLASSNNKTLAGIGKAAAITQATIDGFAAVQKALAAAPPPFNFALAGLVGAATAANVAKIAGVPLRGGIDEVPGIGDRDVFPAVLAPGERVVPAETNQDLKNFLASRQDAGAQITVNVVMNDVFTSDPREMGLQIVKVINDTTQATGVKILRDAVT